MIRRFSSSSKVFVAKKYQNGFELIWQTSLDLSKFKYMAVLDVYTSSWPIDGKLLCHLSSNLTESSNCNPDGHIYTWLKKPASRVKGVACFNFNEFNFCLKNFMHLTGSSLMKLSFLSKI